MLRPLGEVYPGGMMVSHSNGSEFVLAVHVIEFSAAGAIILFASWNFIASRTLTRRSMLVGAWLAVIICAARTAEVFYLSQAFSTAYLVVQSVIFASSFILVCFGTYRQTGKVREVKSSKN
jgi:hypothetical protein